jgi:hypothetical protein
MLQIFHQLFAYPLRLRTGLPSNIGYAKAPAPSDPPPAPEIRHLLIGPEPAVRLTIANLHKRGYAEPNDWTRPLPTGKLGEVMSLLAKRVPLN